MPLPLSDTQYNNNGLPASLPVAQEPLPTSQPTMAQRVVNSLLGTNGQERYQLWPERVVRDALSAPHDVMNSSVPMTSEQMIKPAMDISALAGTGGLAGAEAGALGSGPFLRPALKYEGKIYKAPIKDASNPLFMGAEHSDAIPQSLLPEFTRQAMNGEDISNFNFGFINHKGQFLDREKALDYGIKEGLLSPHDAKFGALTSTMMADSSKEGAAIGSLSDRIAPKTNYRVPISNYTDTLYRESSLQEGLNHFPKEPSNSSTMYDRTYYADHPSMATGQGNNKGIKLEYDSKGFEGQINTDKPLWKPAFEQGYGEYKAQPMTDPKEAVKGITIDTSEFKNNPTWVQSRYRTAMDRLVKEGWTKTKENGIISLKKPKLIEEKT